MTKQQKVESIGKMWTEEPGTCFSQKREALTIARAINEWVKSNTEKSEKNLITALNTVDNIINRSNLNQKWRTNLNQKWRINSISIMDMYYIPDELIDYISDDITLHEIVNWILYKPKDSKEITNDDLDKLIFIFDRAAEYTIRYMEERSIIRSRKNKKNQLWKKKEKKWVRNPGSIDKKENSFTEIWMWYFKNNFGNLVEIIYDTDWKNKVHFKLTSVKDVFTIIRKLLSTKVEILTKKGDIAYKEKSFTIQQKNGLFIKMIYILSDMQGNKAYTSRRTHFNQIIKEMFCPFLKMNGNNIVTKKGFNNEPEYSNDFTIDSLWRNIKGRFIMCSKSTQSIVDKMLRDKKYTSSHNLKDIIRWSIILGKEKNETEEQLKDLICMIHYFIKYFIANPYGEFDHSIFNQQEWKKDYKNFYSGIESWQLWKLERKDKWIFKLLLEYPNILDLLPKWNKPDSWDKKFENEELDWMATNYIKNTIGNYTKEKNENGDDGKKPATSRNYTDTKLNIPIIMRENSFYIELKFLTEKHANTNDKWLQNHAIMRIKQDFEKRFKNEKHLPYYVFKYRRDFILGNEKLIQWMKDAVYQDSTTDKILIRLQTELTKNLDYIKEDGELVGEFLVKSINSRLEKNNFAPDWDIIENYLYTEKNEKKKRNDETNKRWIEKAKKLKEEMNKDWIDKILDLKDKTDERWVEKAKKLKNQIEVSSIRKNLEKALNTNDLNSIIDIIIRIRRMNQIVHLMEYLEKDTVINKDKKKELEEKLTAAFVSKNIKLIKKAYYDTAKCIRSYKNSAKH